MEDAIFELARKTVNTAYEDMPSDVVARAKTFIIDGIGVGLAGSTAAGYTEIFQMIREQGGRPDSSVMVYGDKLPVQEAAFANSLLIHGRDFDDTHEGLGAHCNVTALPAALAVAEKERASGKEFLAAVILGIDVMGQLGTLIPLFHGWHTTVTLGVFAAAAAAGKILKLDEEQMVNAFGIAFHQAAGNRQGRADGAITKRLGPAFASRAGVYSALLAERGLTGAHNIVQGPWGLGRLYGETRDRVDDRRLEEWKAQLSTKYEVINLSVKPYPCCRGNHASIDAALSLMHDYKLGERDVKEVLVQTSEEIYDTVGHPFQIRNNPQVDAQFSISYAVAAAIQGGKVMLEDFEPERVTEGTTANLAKKIVVRVDESLPRWTAVVTFVTNSGKSYSKRIDVIKGNPENPLTKEELIHKFRDCAQHSAKPLAPERLENLLACLEQVDKLQDVNQMVELLV